MYLSKLVKSLVLVNFSEKELLDKLKNFNDERSFDHIFKKFYSPLCSYSKNIIGDINNAEDIVQGFFVEFWRNRNSLSITTSLKSYLYKSIYNRSLNHLRKNKSKEAFDNYIKTTLINEPQTDQDLLVINELERLIYHTIDNLKEPTKQIFRLSRNEDLKYREIAKTLGVSIKTVESHMSKALKILTQNLIDYLPALLLVINPV